MSIIKEFLRTATGRFVWISCPEISIPLEGRVESFDDRHVLLSCERALVCVAIDKIEEIDLLNQVEIIAP